MNTIAMCMVWGFGAAMGVMTFTLTLLGVLAAIEALHRGLE